MHHSASETSIHAWLPEGHIFFHLCRALIISSTEPGILTAGRAGAVGWVLIQALTSLFQVIDKECNPSPAPC